MELTVAAIPGYFSTMAAERAWLRRRARTVGPTPAEYEPHDTATSLAMGTLSLLTPLVLPRAVRAVTHRHGKVRRGLVGSVLVAAALTTAADQVVSWSRRPEHPGTSDIRDLPVHPRAPRAARAARRVAGAGGVVTVVLGLTTVSSTWRQWTTNQRLWGRRLLPDLGAGPVALLAAVLGWDLIYYWNHRLQHESRFMWAIHVVHHSSERYNLSTALRQPVTDVWGTFVPPGLLGLVGIRPALTETARGVNLLYQYWIHTETVGRLGPAEQVLNSPSHHRVHHGSNRRYLDRNHGSILILWDRLFGTFEPEGERPVYGLTRNISTFNPWRVITHEYVDMLGDVARSTTWHDRLSFVLRGPGWAYARRPVQGIPG